MNEHNVFAYLEWRGDLTFDREPFNEVDNLILSMISFLDFSGIAEEREIGIMDAVKEVEKAGVSRRYFGALIPDATFDLAKCAAATPRFREARVCAFQNIIDEDAVMQFAAVTFLLPDDSIFVAFRGTDDTLVGWKEDCNLSYIEVPAQQCATAYLQAIAAHYPGGIRIGGHSKGGNLALWAAVHVPREVRDRILSAQSNDGPGFSTQVLEMPEFTELGDRLLTLIPQSSVVGVLLERGNRYEIIHSTQQAVMQHDPFSWVIIRTKFERVSERSAFGKRSEERLRNWINAMSPEERREFTETLFSVLTAGNAQTLTDINKAKLKSAAAMVRVIRSMDKEQKKRMNGYLKKLLSKDTLSEETKTDKQQKTEKAAQE